MYQYTVLGYTFNEPKMTDICDLFFSLFSARKFFPITFIGSILWIAGFSYLMVWWATITGETFSIPPPVSTYSNCILECHLLKKWGQSRAKWRKPKPKSKRALTLSNNNAHKNFLLLPSPRRRAMQATQQTVVVEDTGMTKSGMLTMILVFF